MTVRGLISHIDLNVSDPVRSIPLYGLVLEHLGFRRCWVEPVDGRASLTDAQAGDRCAWWIPYGGGATLGIEVRPPARPAPRSHHERYSPASTTSPSTGRARGPRFAPRRARRRWRRRGRAAP